MQQKSAITWRSIIAEWLTLQKLTYSIFIWELLQLINLQKKLQRQPLLFGMSVPSLACRTNAGSCLLLCPRKNLRTEGFLYILICCNTLRRLSVFLPAKRTPGWQRVDLCGFVSFQIRQIEFMVYCAGWMLRMSYIWCEILSEES